MLLCGQLKESNRSLRSFSFWSLPVIVCATFSSWQIYKLHMQGNNIPRLLFTSGTEGSVRCHAKVIISKIRFVIIASRANRFLSQHIPIRNRTNNEINQIYIFNFQVRKCISTMGEGSCSLKIGFKLNAYH